jgi:hypothetical protein
VAPGRWSAIGAHTDAHFGFAANVRSQLSCQPKTRKTIKPRAGRGGKIRPWQAQTDSHGSSTP